MINRQVPLLYLIVMLTVLITAGACGGSSGTSTLPNTMPTLQGSTLSKNVQPIFNNACVVCHQGAGQAGLTLEPGKSYANLVNVASTESPEKRVAPGAPDQSYLLAKLNGTQVQAGGSGSQMPLSGPPLTQAQLNVIREWIQIGAPNN